MSLFAPHNLAVLAPVLAVVAAALLVLVADWFRRDEDPRLSAALSLAGLAGAGVLVWQGWSEPAGAAFAVSGPGEDVAGLLRADRFGLFATGALVAAALLSVLSSVAYTARRGIGRAEYYALLLLSVAGMMLLVLANDLVVLFLSLELFSLALYVLAAFLRGDRASQEAGLKYFVLGAFAAGFLFYGTALVYAATGTTNLDLIGRAVAETAILPLMVPAGLALLLVGLGFKVAAAPFHQWTPDVYQGAPLPVTGFMAAATKVAAMAALARVLWTAFGDASDGWLPLLAGLAIVTMLVGNLAALVQADLKRMLAYSSVAQAGYVLVAIAAGPPAGTAAALFYLLVYALMTLGAFAVLAGIGPVGEEGREAARLDDLRGLAGRHPALAFAMAVFLLGLTGLPPTAGFLGKWYIFQAAVDAGLAYLAVAVVVNSVVSAFYYLRPVALMYMAPPVEDRPIVVSTPDSVAVAVTTMLVALALVLAVPLAGAAQSASALGGADAGPTGGDVVPVFVAPPVLERQR
jgi:NADH-quinone oxidoreductase subunit N